jgi:SAM-dependent methyltransferase
MTAPEAINYSFTRYLAAKKSVDDRALNLHVWRALEAGLPSRTPLRILEVGAGIGTMIERMLEWGLLKNAQYTALDEQPQNLAYARQRLIGWGNNTGFQVEERLEGLHLTDAERDVEINLVAGDILDWVAADAQPSEKGWDALVAHAFLDLVDIPALLPGLFGMLASGGIYYLSLNFDGLTVFEPILDIELDQQVLDLFHRSMNKRRTGGRISGDSQTGRHLFNYLQDLGVEILAAGASDWVVHPNQGRYGSDEAYFLHYIIHTIDRELSGNAGLEIERFKGWVAGRHAQIEAGKLVYIAHQVDIVGRI